MFAIMQAEACQEFKGIYNKLERLGMTPEWIAKLTEEETKTLYDWAMGVLEKLLHLDPEKKCEIANEAMKKVWMPPNSGPGGAERFIRE